MTRREKNWYILLAIVVNIVLALASYVRSCYVPCLYHLVTSWSRMIFPCSRITLFEENVGELRVRVR